jgi:hypothetical protein
LGSGDVGGVWKSSIGVGVGDWGEGVFDLKTCWEGEVDILKGLVGVGLMARFELQWGGEGGGVARLSKSWMVITFVLQGVEDVVEVVRLRKSWIGEEMLSEASLDEDELDFVVLLKQQGFTLILVVLAHDFDDSDEVLDLVI